MATFLPAFMDNLTFHTSEQGPSVGGYLINTMLQNNKQHDVSIMNENTYTGGEAKFENLGVPVGLFHKNMPPPISKQQIKEIDGGFIDEKLFNKLFDKVATAKKHNKTQKNKSTNNDSKRRRK